MYFLLSGRVPFNSSSSKELMKKIKIGTFTFESFHWDNVSDEAKDLISKLLVVDPTKRYTASQAFKHSWFKKVNQLQQVKLNPHILGRLGTFKYNKKFTKEVMKIMV